MSSFVLARLAGLRSLVTRYPIVFNTTAVVTMIGIGDSLQQTIGKHLLEKRTDGQPERKFDWQRFQRVTSAGLLLGPLNHFWYGWLDRRFPLRTASHVMAKVMLDWTSCPLFTSTYWTVISLQEGKDLAECMAEYMRSFRLVCMLDAMVWPPTMFISFAFMPAKYRVLYVSCIQLFYNASISYIKHDMQHKNGHDDDDDASTWTIHVPHEK